MSRLTSPIDVDDTASQASKAPSASTSTLTNPFGRMMASSTSQPTPKRDRCSRLTPTYNEFYDPEQPPPADLPKDYSPYANGQPLWDDRPVLIANLPKYHILEGATKRARTAWVWKLGYALIDNSKPSKPSYWACKLCMLPVPTNNNKLIKNRSSRRQIFPGKEAHFQH
jgi:hypothetical protein